MFTAEHRSLFDSTFYRLAAPLQFIGFHLRRLDQESDDDERLWSWLTDSEISIPSISLWYGSWFPSLGNRFWLGFQGEKSQVEIVQKAAVGTGLVDISAKRTKTSALDEKIVREQHGIAFEHDSVNHYFGQYQLDLKSDFEGAAIDFVNKVYEEVNLNEIKKSSKIEATERAALILARRGQGRFRDALDATWNGKCALTGCSTREVLRASHIKPWKHCEDDAQRLDVHNGLLLSTNLDALFDKGLIRAIIYLTQ